MEKSMTSTVTAERNAELGIPTLPLATITSSSFGTSSGVKHLQEMGSDFNTALGTLTQAIFRSADALETCRSGASSTESVWKGPLPRHLEPPAAPFTNFADLRVDSPAMPARTAPPMRAPTPAGIIASGTATRPSGYELERMAEDIAERCGEDQLEPATVMLSLMTDVLFGGGDQVALRRNPVLEGVQRPTPRTLEAIAQRVVQRTGNADKDEAVRGLLLQLTNSVFGPSHGTQDDLPTARSSVRSQSTSSEEVKEEVNLEVRYLMTELCGEIFTDQ
jgi:hypothetical protein